MASWTEIPNSSLETGAPARSVDALAFRDNPIAIAEGATGAPKILNTAFNDLTIGAEKLQAGTYERDWVGARASELTVYAIGSYIFAIDETTVTRNPGSTIAGSSIRPSSINSSEINGGSVAQFSTGTGIAGTWRLMGYSIYSAGFYFGASLWLRIA